MFSTSSLSRTSGLLTALVTFLLSTLLLSFAQGTNSVHKTSQPGAPSSAVGDVPRYAYAVEANAGEEGAMLATYSVNAATGNLRPRFRLPLPSDNGGVVVDPSGKFLFVPDGPKLEGYHIALDGSVHPLAGSPFNTFGGSTLVFTPNGKFAYNNLGTEYSFNASTGNIVQIGTANVASNAVSVAVDPSGAFVYILDNTNSASISAFSIDQDSGQLTEILGSPFMAGVGRLYTEVISPDGKFLYLSGFDSVTGDFAIAAFSINSDGTLTPAAGSPFTASSFTTGLVIDPAGHFLYSVGTGVDVYSIDSTTGALSSTPGSPYTLPTNASNEAIDPSGRFLYVTLFSADTLNPGIVSFSVNPTTGALTSLGRTGSLENMVEALAISTGPKAVTYTPKFAYATNQTSHTISEWTITPATGVLTSVAGSPLNDSNGPQSLAATPSGSFVFTANSNNTVSEYSVNPTTGALTAVSGSPIGGFAKASAVLVDPTGKYLLVLDPGKPALNAYSINPTTGKIALISSALVSAQSLSLAIDPTGVIAIVCTGSQTQTYFLDGGVLSGAALLPANLVVAAAADQSSQYLFLVKASSNTVMTVPLYPVGGTVLSRVSTGNNPRAIYAEASGRYVYVANVNDGTISSYTLNLATGALKPLGTAIPSGAGTSALSGSNDGKFLYATNKTAGTVSIFKIGANGTLTAAGTTATGTAPTSIATTGSVF